jgi:hypothetical protein
MADEKPPLVYRYRIRFSDGAAVTVGVRIDPDTLELRPESGDTKPAEWTELKANKCPNCPLHEEQNEHCPAALSLTGVLGRFEGRETYEEVDVVVEGPQRTYAARTTLGTAVASLLGLFMPTSGCPILAKLRPMVDMHLPFQTRDETSVRLVSTYLAAQHLLHRAGQTPDWELAGLTDQLQQVQLVNRAFAKRLEAVPQKDVAIEALRILASSADLSGKTPTERGMARLEQVVKAVYFE